DLCGNCLSTLPGHVGLVAIDPATTEFKEGVDLAWRRSSDTLYTNVRWRVRHHSPTGMEVGFMGSGCADFALNALAAILPPIENERREKCWDGNTVSYTVWSLHQKFKRTFLATANRDEGRIPWDDIIAWIQAQRDELEKALRDGEEELPV